MIGNWTIYIILTLYMGLMYLIARWGDQQDFSKNQPIRVVIYSFSLAVYCTSWTFFGAVGTAVQSGWSFLPIYLGPIILFTFGWPLVKKIINISKKKNVTSIADFIASLYEKSRRIAIVVTCIAVIASIPYIALQLETIAASLRIISAQNISAHDEQFRILMITLMLAFFAMIFGTKKLDVTEHHRGLMMAIAFESFIKLLAFMAVGLFVTFFVYSGPADMLASSKNMNKIAGGPILSFHFISQVMLAFLVFMCLPRQFHVTVVENENKADLAWSRWIFVTYLVIFSLLVIPIASAGSQWLGNSVSADFYVLQLPMLMQQEWLTVLVLFGGLAAATGMVIISTIALSTMVSNDLVLPVYLKYKKYNLPRKIALQDVVLWSRRISIAIITTLAYLFYYSLDVSIPLAAFGNLSFLLTVQFAPALLLGIYWPHSDKKAAFAGLLTGVVVWVILVFFPQWFNHTTDEMTGILYTLNQLTSDRSPLLKLVVYSLLSNVMVHISIALYVKYVKKKTHGIANHSRDTASTEAISVNELKTAVSKIVGVNAVNEAYHHFFQGLNDDISGDAQVSTPMIQFTERLLSGSVGSSSARAIVTALLKSKGLAVDEIISLLDETSQAVRFQRRITDATLDSISQGVSVIDSELRLVAWNQQYLTLLNYPEGMVYKGMPIEELIQFNATRGLMGTLNVSNEVEKRLIYLRKRVPYRHERQYDGSRYLQIEGNPMPDQCYVTTYTDVSHYKLIEQKLLKSENDIRFYTDNAPAMLAYVDKNHQLKFANKAYLQFFSKNGDQLIDRHIDTLYLQTDLQKRMPYLVTALTGIPQTFEMELNDIRGVKHFVLGNYVPDSEEQQVKGVFVIIQDISSRRKAELALQKAKSELEQRVNERTLELLKTNQQLETAKQKAEKANSSKTKFIADASHDLLQPFNAARLFSSLLSEQSHQLPQELKNTVLNLDQSLKSAENLLGALLDIAKIDAGGMTVEKNHFCIKVLFDQLKNQYQSLASKKSLKFTIMNSNYAVYSDQKLLYRVLQNLTYNALKYTEKGGVLIGCRKRAEQLQILVIDTGIGLSESEQDIIFQEFLRLNKVKDQGSHGLGLGLSIVERIVKQLDHPLNIISEPLKGSTFLVTVPLTDPKLVEQQSVIEAPLGVHENKPCILCIDNEQQILTGMNQLLSNWGYPVHCANGSQQALSLLKQGKKARILLVDYHLDNETGLTTIDQIKKQFPEQYHVVIITANRTETLRKTIEEEGYSLLLKPIKPAMLRNIISKFN